MVKVGTLDIGTKVVYAETYLDFCTNKPAVEHLHLTVSARLGSKSVGYRILLENPPRRRLVDPDTLVELEA